MAASAAGFASSLLISAVAAALVLADAFDMCPESNGGCGSYSMDSWMALARPSPPYDSGHMSKASATTKAAATALMSKDLVKPKQLRAATGLLWDHAIERARAKRRKGRARVASAG